MDPTEKTKHPIYHPSTSNNHPHHPTPSIQYISSNFSKLYTNHKILSSLKPTEKVIHSHPHQEPSKNTTSLKKPVPILSNLDSSCTTLTKSKSQHGTRFSTKTNVVKEKILVKLPNFEQVHKKIEKFEKYPKGEYEITYKEWKTKEPIEENMKKQDVKKAQSLKSLSFNEGCCDVKKAQSFMFKSNNEGFCDEKKGQSLMGRSYNEGSCDVKRPSFSVGGNGGGGRRKSFCSSQTEMADFFLCNSVKVVAVDMPPYMQIHAVDCARKAHDSLEKFTARSLASTLKREFDGVYGPAWHCIVGTSFGSFVTHSVGGFMYFSMDQKLYILLFKTTVQKAE